MWRQLLDSALQAPLPPVEPPTVADEAYEARQMQRALAQGQAAKMWRKLTGPGLAPDTAAAWDMATDKLVPLGTSAPEAKPCPPPELVKVVTDSMVHSAITRLKPCRALDAAGWSHECIQSLWQLGEVRKSLLPFLARCYAASLDEGLHPFVHSYRAVVLKKSSTSPAIRPILISLRFRKVWASAVASVLTPMFQDQMRDLQFGAGTPDRVASFAAVVQAAVLDDDQPSVLRLDIRNAFSSLDRQTLMTQLRQLPIPELEPWLGVIQHILGSPLCVLRSVCAQRGACYYESTYNGLAQGDPLSSHLFCVSIAQCLRTAMGTVPGCRGAAYVDDVVIAAAPDALQQLVGALERQLGGVALRQAAVPQK